MWKFYPAKATSIGYSIDGPGMAIIIFQTLIARRSQQRTVLNHVDHVICMPLFSKQNHEVIWSQYSKWFWISSEGTDPQIPISQVIGIGTGGPWLPRFCNFSTGIRLLPYKTTLLSLYGPPDLSAFLHSWIRCYVAIYGIMNIAQVVVRINTLKDCCYNL